MRLCERLSDFIFIIFGVFISFVKFLLKVEKMSFTPRELIQKLSARTLKQRIHL
jgi:hypothetical protein